MATAIRPIGHEDRLSLVGHLDELRTRLIVSALALGLAFAVCMWQNHVLLGLINKPLEVQTHREVARGRGPLGQTALAQQGVLAVARDTQAIVTALAEPTSRLPPATRATLAAEIPRLEEAIAKIPRVPGGEKPVTLGIGEPFLTTLTVTFIFALIFALPVILFELYGFVLPAFTPPERRAVIPLLLSVPFLFAAGVLFGYFVVLPAAVRFFQNFNSSEFNVLVQAGPYYKFAATILLAMGLVFQLPVVVVGAVRADLVTPRQLRKGRRYALLACAAIAAFLPGDLVTMTLEMIPLYALYELSIVVASMGRRHATATRAAPAGDGPGEDDPPPGPDDPSRPTGPPLGGSGAGEQPSVREIIDHVDPGLSG